MKARLPRFLLIAVLAAVANNVAQADVKRERSLTGEKITYTHAKGTVEAYLQDVVTTVTTSADPSADIRAKTTDILDGQETSITDAQCCIESGIRVCGTHRAWFTQTPTESKPCYVTNNLTLNVEGTNNEQIYFLYGKNGSDSHVLGDVRINVMGNSNIGYLVGGSQTTGISAGTTTYEQQGDVYITLSENAKVGQIRGGCNGVDGGAEGLMVGDITITVKDNAQITGIIERENKTGLDAIRGCGGSGYSVNGKVTINVQDNAQITGDIYAGARNKNDQGSAYVNETEINISGGYIKGDVYGGGSFDDAVSTIVKGNTNIVMTGGNIDGNLYAGGCGSVVEGSSTIKLLGGNVSGIVSGGGSDGLIKNEDNIVIGVVESVVKGGSVLYIGDEQHEYQGSVGGIEGFEQIVVAQDSFVTYTAGNTFATKEQSYTLSTANLSQAVSTLGAGASAAVDGTLTLNLDAAGKLTAGKYMIIDASQGSVDLSNWSADTVTVNGIASFEDLVWEGNVLTFIFRSPDVDNIVASNWGVFKSSQAFVGTLWDNNRTNAVEISPATADGKGGLQPAGRTLAWGTVYAQSARIGGVGADYSLWGGAIGVEHQFVSGRSIGAAVGYDWGTVSPFNSGDIDQESTHFGLYGRAAAWQVGQKGAITLDWSAAVGNTTSECDSISGDWDQNTLQLDARVSYLRSLSERTTGSVFAGLQYFAAEDATAGELGVSSMQNLRTEIGAGLSYRATQKTTVYGEVSVYNDAMRHNPYVLGAGQRFEGTNPGRLGGSVSAGVNYQINDAWSLRGNYSFDAADDSTEHNVNVGAAYQF